MVSDTNNKQNAVRDAHSSSEQIKPTDGGDTYAVIDLGSNSFHMLIAKSVAGSIHTIGRVKRKVRLASGLDDDNILSQEAMARGWECLSLFAERLQDIKATQIRIVATATLRLAKNADEFVQTAERILGHPINIISGEQEAKTIYQGVAQTSACQGKQLVIDIGGASTEAVIGERIDAITYHSLNMGCVTYLERYFPQGVISSANFDNAIKAAKAEIATVKKQLLSTGWQFASGASGTVQAIQEILIAQKQSEVLTLSQLQAIKQQTCQFKDVDSLTLVGLSEERRLVFVSGLAILIALFESLNIKAMGLAGGALREGVLYSMLPELQNDDIRARTVAQFIARYHLDEAQAGRVAKTAQQLYLDVANKWQWQYPSLQGVLTAAAKLHEIGLLVDYKHYQNHTGYIVKNSDMPGFSQIEHKLVGVLCQFHRAEIDKDVLAALDAYQSETARLIVLLRLSVILSMRRKDDVLCDYQIKVTQNTVSLIMDKAWLDDHPLMAAELQTEQKHFATIGYQLTIATN